MWVGESEKNIKGIFDDYKQKVKQSVKAPILLFNEADAIIGKRQVGAERAVEKMENSIQNIILQEIEQLDGILIATTNLAENMDKAFERRFLYKVKFEKPDLACRSQIWQAMIPSLEDADASFLAARYDFPSISMKSLAINAFLIPCTLAEISRRYSFSTGWACFFLRYLQQWFFSFTYLAFSLGRYGWFLLGLCRNFTRLSLGFGVSWNLQLRTILYFS